MDKPHKWAVKHVGPINIAMVCAIKDVYVINMIYLILMISTTLTVTVVKLPPRYPV